MSERDELATDLHLIIKALRNTTDKRMMVCSSVDRAQVVDAILAAGYRKPQTITTAEELGALPDGSAVLDADQDVSTKHNGMWHGYEMNPLDSRKFAKCGPFIALYTPEPAA